MKADCKMSKESSQGSQRGSGADVRSSSHQQLPLLGASAYRDTGVGVVTSTAHWHNPLPPIPTLALSFSAGWVAGLSFEAAKMPRKNKKSSPLPCPSSFFPQLHMV